MPVSLVDRFPILYQRDLIDPLGSLRGPDKPSSDLTGGGPLAGAASRIASGYFVGRSGRALRIDVGLSVEARTDRAMDMLPEIRQTVTDAVADTALARAIGASAVTIAMTGETPLYGDMRELRTRDFAVVAVAAIGVVFAILLLLIRSPLQSAILVGATILTFLATYGASSLILNAAFGLEGVSWQVHFLLFVIILSLGNQASLFEGDCPVHVHFDQVFASFLSRGEFLVGNIEGLNCVIVLTLGKGSCPLDIECPAEP